MIVNETGKGKEQTLWIVGAFWTFIGEKPEFQVVVWCVPSSFVKERYHCYVKGKDDFVYRRETEKPAVI